MTLHIRKSTPTQHIYAVHLVHISQLSHFVFFSFSTEAPLQARVVLSCQSHRAPAVWSNLQSSPVSSEHQPLILWLTLPWRECHQNDAVLFAHVTVGDARCMPVPPAALLPGSPSQAVSAIPAPRPPTAFD